MWLGPSSDSCAWALHLVRVQTRCSTRLPALHCHSDATHGNGGLLGRPSTRTSLKGHLRGTRCPRVSTTCCEPVCIVPTYSVVLGCRCSLAGWSVPVQVVVCPWHACMSAYIHTGTCTSPISCMVCWVPGWTGALLWLGTPVDSKGWDVLLGAVCTVSRCRCTGWCGMGSARLLACLILVLAMDSGLHHNGTVVRSR